MPKLRIEGVIVKALPFNDYDQILTVFTEQEGMIKLIVKGAYSRKRGHGAATSPLIKAEFIYSKGRGELDNCSEISPLNAHLKLRSSWNVLQAAGSMVQAVLHTQQLHKPAPLL